MKKFKSFWRIIGLVIFLSLFPLQSASADAGPKLPPVTFDFEFQTQPAEVKNLVMLMCDEAQCLNPKPTGKFSCYENRCWSFWMPDDSPYYKIEVEFSDQVRTSHIFTRVRLSAVYTVTVSADGLSVREIFKSWLAFDSPAPFVFVLALVVTVLTETLVARFFSNRWNAQIKWVMLVNFISLPILWFIFPMLPVPLVWVWLLGEAFVIFFEAVFLYFVNRGSQLSIRQFGLLSLVMNLFSIVTGVVGVPIIIIGLFSAFFYFPQIGIIFVLLGLFFLLAYLPAKLMGKSIQK